MANLLGPEFRHWLETHTQELIAFRRHLHAHPEPSGKEHQTTEAIVERLSLAGLEPRVLAYGTGLVCDIGTGDGPIVALRADIDALEMVDEKNVSYRSTVPGVAHACGHDVHTTIVLGTGLHLADRVAAGEDAGVGRVRLIFQPAEERVPGGALEVIADDGLKGVGTILGVHCHPKLEVGRIGLRVGGLTSAADMVEVTLTGPGGHTARPEETVNMIDLAGRIITEMPERVGAELGERGPFKLVFGSVHSGEAANVIPTHAVIRGSVRTPSLDAWEALPDAFDRALSTIVGSTGAGVEVNYVHGVPPVVNDEAVVERVRRAAADELGSDAITEADQSWGGDDFAWYQRETAGAYVRLGTHDPEGDHEPHDIHVGNFDVDERAIAVGVRLLTAVLADTAD